MSRKRGFDPQALCAGMHTGIEFLSKLQKAIERNGGNELLLWFMTLDKSAEKLEELAKFAVAQHYPIPRSVIKNRVAALALENGATTAEEIESDSNFKWCWLNLEREYGIPVLSFGSEADRIRPEIPLPLEIEKQIVGKPLSVPTLIQYDGEEYLVVGLHHEEEHDPNEGVVREKVGSIHIAPAKCFDLEN